MSAVQEHRPGRVRGQSDAADFRTVKRRSAIQSHSLAVLHVQGLWAALPRHQARKRRGMISPGENAALAKRGGGRLLFAT